MNSIVRTVFAEYVDEQRWVCWKYEYRNGKDTKPPINPKTGHYANSTDPQTWTTFQEAIQAQNTFQCSGLGIMLGHGLGGVDLDACRNPDTGALTSWAYALIADFKSYAEVSPSKTGVKIWARGAPLELPANSIAMNTPPIQGKAAKIEVFTHSRYFAITGEILQTVPEEIANCGDEGGAWDRLIRRLSQRGMTPDHSDTPLPERFLEDLQNRETLAKLWKSGKDGGADRSRNDAALAAMLGRLGYPDDAIETALRHYPLGQIGQGILKGTTASRQIVRLLGIAAAARRNKDPNPEVREPEIWQLPEHWRALDVNHLHQWKSKPLQPVVDGLLAHGNFVLIAAQSQTGKTLLALYLARAVLHEGLLFGKYRITPVDHVQYLLLEDPDRRAEERLLEIEHEFPALEPNRFIVHVAPSFTLTDDRMRLWMESLIAPEARTVLIIDTYQKATPGVASFDDEKQGEILHGLANLTRQRRATLIILDHFRKESNNGKRRELSIDDVKGTGGKVQNADCVILLERTPDKKQLRFQAFSKDFDSPVRILLDVSPKGSTEPKFTYAAALESMGNASHEAAELRKHAILVAMPPGVWMSVDAVVAATQEPRRTVQRTLSALAHDGFLDRSGSKGRSVLYCRMRQLDCDN